MSDVVDKGRVMLAHKGVQTRSTGGRVVSWCVWQSHPHVRSGDLKATCIHSDSNANILGSNECPEGVVSDSAARSWWVANCLSR